MKKPIYSLFLACILLGPLSIVMSQDVTTQANDESSYEDSRRTMRVVAFGAESGFDVEPLYYSKGGKKMQLFTAVGSLSTSMPMPKGEFMKLYQEEQLPIEGSTETKVSYREVGTVPLVSGSKAIVLLVVPADLTKEKIRGRAFKDSLALHPRETARVFNMSKKVVAIRVGKESLKLAVGETGTVPWKAVAFNSVSYQVGTQGKDPGTWEVIESSECAAHPDMRTFVFIGGAMIENRETVTTSTFLDPVPDNDTLGDGDTP